MEFGQEWRILVMLSRYDGEEYPSEEYSLEEAQHSESIKRAKLVDEGYDVDLYDEIYQQLTEEYLGKFKKTKNIFERSDLYDEYEQKKKDLAKEFFGIDVEHVSLYSK